MKTANSGVAAGCAPVLCIILSIMNSQTNSEAGITAEALIRMGRESKPFRLLLDGQDGEAASVECSETVRSIPGKRMVCRGSWQGRAVFAKLYLDGRKDWQRELDGLAALHAAGIPAPEVNFSGTADEGNIHIILLDEIKPAETLQHAWNVAPDDRVYLSVLENLLGVVASHHQAGLVQTDIHLDNFLLSGGEVITLDGGGIRQSGQVPLPLEQSLDNLGLLLAQLPPVFDALVKTVLPVYERTRHWNPGALPLPLLMRRVDRQRHKRVQRYLSKVFRDCSAFSCSRSWSRFQVWDRELESPELQALLLDPDASLSDPGTRLLKQGNTCTLWITQVGAQQLVVKRYNIKNAWHLINRALRRTRATISWEIAHRLTILGIATARPVALVEERFGLLRGRAWYISEFVPGDSAAVLCGSDESAVDRKAWSESIVRLLQQLEQCRISHGDMKATNFILARQGPVMIDLDAMREHSCESAFKRRWRRDIQRFMRNWDECPAVAGSFKGLLLPR